MGSHSGHSGLAEEAGAGIAPGDATVQPVIPVVKPHAWISRSMGLLLVFLRGDVDLVGGSNRL